MPERIKFNARRTPKDCRRSRALLCCSRSLSLTGCIKLCIKMALMTFIQLCQPRKFPAHTHTLARRTLILWEAEALLELLNCSDNIEGGRARAAPQVLIPPGIKIVTKMPGLQFKIRCARVCVCGLWLCCAGVAWRFMFTWRIRDRDRDRDRVSFRTN